MNVLIIEDDEAVAMWLGKFLRQVSTSVTIAPNLREGIRHIAMQSPPFDIISLDLGLPDSIPEQTIESIESIKKSNPNCLLVVLTGHRQPEYQKAALGLGADAYFDKSESITSECQGFFSQLSDAISSLINGPKKYSPTVDKLEFIAKTIAKRAACKIP